MSETISQMTLLEENEIDVAETFVPVVIPDSSNATGFENYRILAAALVGAKWYTGLGVPDSALGLNEDWYLNSTTGVAYNKIAGAWTEIITLKGADGTNGTDGTDGVGVPTGGSSGQVLAKNSATDYDTHWVDQTGGSGSIPDFVLQNGGII